MLNWFWNQHPKISKKTVLDFIQQRWCRVVLYVWVQKRRRTLCFYQHLETISVNMIMMYCTRQAGSQKMWFYKYNFILWCSQTQKTQSCGLFGRRYIIARGWIRSGSSYRFHKTRDKGWLLLTWMETKTEPRGLYNTQSLRKKLLSKLDLVPWETLNCCCVTQGSEQDQWFWSFTDAEVSSDAW